MWQFDLGPCHFEHDVSARAAYRREPPSRRKRRLEEFFLRNLERIARDCDLKCVAFLRQRGS